MIAALRMILLMLSVAAGLAPAPACGHRGERASRTDYVAAGQATFRLAKTGSTFTPTYEHQDHQGSAVAGSASNGSISWRESYLPHGRPIKFGAPGDQPSYTGHVTDSVTDLVYMQARHDDPAIGRFLSTDPIGYQDQLNLYAYVYNDPINNTDPTGECPWCLVGALISITVEAAQIAKEGDVGIGEGAARIVIAGASGAIGTGVGGAIAKVGTTVLRSAVSGAVGGAVASATAETGSQTNQAITGNGFDGTEVVEAAKTGAVVGGVVGGVTAAAAANTDLPAVAAQAADRTKTAIVTTGESIGDVARDAAQEAGALDDDKRH